MCRVLVGLGLGVLVLSLAADGVQAAPLQQGGGADGIVSVEAEHFDDNVEQSNRQWQEVGPTGDFTGVAGMQVTGLAQINAGYAATSPRMDYQVNFVKTGTHYIWIRAWGAGGGDDSCHAGLDGAEIDTCDRLQGWNLNYGWSNTTMDSPQSSFEVPSAGIHTLNIWMREDGLIVDKIVLTTNPDYVPADDGPPESPRGLPAYATAPAPADGATDVPREVTLAWSPGPFAATHDVYFGTAFDDVNLATRANPLDVLVGEGQTDTTYDLTDLLDFGQTYYWRVDEVNAAPDDTIVKGNMWHFTAEPLAYAIENTTASASDFDEGRAPENTINGSGLDAEDLHSDVREGMWQATTDGTEPVWIQYEFDRLYKLHEMWVWNFNVAYEVVLGYGLKDVTVEYSADGVTWTTLGDVEFARAPASTGYAHNTVVDLAGVAARYVRLTANSNWGGQYASYGLSEVRFFYVPAHPREPQPANGQTDVDPKATLAWRAGREAVAHEVYFSRDMNAVTEGTALIDTVTTDSYAPDLLDFGATYYWKITEINEAATPSAWEGNLWSFTVRDSTVIDDFESYTDDTESNMTIFDTWIDGWVNGTGSTVGYFEVPFAETSIVYEGKQSMPLTYANADAPYYSETERTFTPAQDWTVSGADTLTVHFQGRPSAFTELADGRIIMGASGEDIWDTSDEFRFGYQRLNGNGSIVARVENVVDIDDWVKAGMMIRSSLAPGAPFAAVYMTGDNGVRFQARLTTGEAATSDTSVATAEQIALTEPVWIRIERTGDTFNGYYSVDGENWVAMSWNPQTIVMNPDVYIGLAVTSNIPDTLTTAQFSGVEATGNVTGGWQVETIGPEEPEGNAPGTLYVAVEDTAGQVQVVTHPAGLVAALLAGWNEWQIPFSDLAGVDLSQVATLYIGVGDRDNPTPGGDGLIYIDDITFGKPATTE